MVEYTVTSVSSLIDALRSIKASDMGPVWYRGHADVAWKLLPNYLRLRDPLREIELLGRFRQNAQLLLSQIPKDVNDFGWMFLMQHYGVPTRLLDWTESPLVALYFALTENDPKASKRDGAIWVLFPRELNRHAAARDVYIPSFEDDWLNNYTATSYDKKKDAGILPIAAIATRNNPRIQAQLGVFTIHHLKAIAIEHVEDRKHCVKIVIPKSAKAHLRGELQMLGITTFQMFPELSSLGDILRSELT